MIDFKKWGYYGKLSEVLTPDQMQWLDALEVEIREDERMSCVEDGACAWTAYDVIDEFLDIARMRQHDAKDAYDLAKAIYGFTVELYNSAAALRQEQKDKAEEVNE